MGVTMKKSIKSLGLFTIFLFFTFSFAQNLKATYGDVVIDPLVESFNNDVLSKTNDNKHPLQLSIIQKDSATKNASSIGSNLTTLASQIGLINRDTLSDLINKYHDCLLDVYRQILSLDKQTLQQGLAAESANHNLTVAILKFAQTFTIKLLLENNPPANSTQDLENARQFYEFYNKQEELKNNLLFLAPDKKTPLATAIKNIQDFEQHEYGQVIPNTKKDATYTIKRIIKTDIGRSHRKLIFGINYQKYNNRVREILINALNNYFSEISKQVSQEKQKKPYNYNYTLLYTPKLIKQLENDFNSITTLSEQPHNLYTNAQTVLLEQTNFMQILRNIAQALNIQLAADLTAQTIIAIINSTLKNGDWRRWHPPVFFINAILLRSGRYAPNPASVAKEMEQQLVIFTELLRQKLVKPSVNKTDAQPKDLINLNTFMRQAAQILKQYEQYTSKHEDIIKSKELCHEAELAIFDANNSIRFHQTLKI